MGDQIQEEINLHHDVKQWQHCSLFNLDLFNDEHDYQQINLTKHFINNPNLNEHCCSSSTPNVDETLGKKHLDSSCSFAVLQKNYTTQLEHVAEKLLSNENDTLNNCSYCSIHDINDTKVQSLNRKILLGSTAIFDNFLRNNLKTSLFINSNNPPSSSTTTNINSTSIVGSSNQRRWHSERASRHPNVRANLPLTSAQRQVLERYMNYPLIKPVTTIRSTRRSHHHHQPVTGKVIENTGTALSALTEQSINPISSLHLRTNSVSPRHNSVAEDDHITSEDEINELNQISILPNLSNLHETLSECSICCELKRLQKRPCCQFYACSTCLNIYVEQQIKQGIIRMQCPNHRCHIYMHRDEIHKRCLSPELRHKFIRYFIDNNRSINIKTCPRCSNIHEIDVELCQSMRRAPTKVQCVECNLIWCFQCHSPWHDGIQCNEFRRGDRMLKRWAKEVHYGQHNAQQCPSCKVYIQRTKGCDHIICSRCKTEFCYKCGDRFRDIKFIGDHYSELSVLGCKYRFHPDNPLKRRLIRGSILGGKILAAPVLLCLAVVAGAVCAGIGLPAYCCFMLVRRIKAKQRNCRHTKLKEPVLMNFPHESMNMYGIKSGIDVEIDPASDAPIAVFDECDIHISINQKR